jgi:Glycosyl transferase family 2
MRLIGHMVIRNELERYLTTTLPWLTKLCDGQVAVYDDQSTDGTLDYAQSLNICVARRQDAIPSFTKNEGIFRWAGWQAMERALSPRAGDWILAVDADEILVSKTVGADPTLVVTQLYETIAEAEALRQRTATFRVAEIFGFDGMGWPLERTDGYWGAITAARLARWQTQGIFEARQEGGGSLPSAWPRATTVETRLELLHYGHATSEDRTTKHERYRTGTGHNPQHVASILTVPTLRHWAGMRPPSHDHSR